MLSGATPPAAYVLQPNLLIGYSLYYGSGALLARELALRWRRGWAGALLLGAAFGTIEEGLGTKIFFDPNRVELSPLVNYAVVGGVQWLFACQLVIYHAVFSIGLPILLVELTFPAQRHTLWVTKRGLVAAFICVVILTFALALVYPYQPAPGESLLALLLVAAFVLAARLLPVSWRTTSASSRVRLSYCSFVGCIATTCFLLLSFGAPSIGVPPVIIVLGLLLTVTLTVRWVRRHVDGQSLRMWSLVGGLLTPWVLLAFVQETRGHTGSSLVGVVAVVYLILLRRRLNAATLFESLR